MCLTGKDHLIEFCKHSGMVYTKFNHKQELGLVLNVLNFPGLVNNYANATFFGSIFIVC